jgi:hypothetical protein
LERAAALPDVAPWKWETTTRIFLGVGLALFGWFIAGLHLLLFDEWFLRRGSLKRLLQSDSPRNNSDLTV